MKIHFALIYILIIALFISCKQQQTPAPGMEHPQWTKNNTIYELNTRQFSHSGTFKAVEQRLIALKELGIKTIWFMPVHPIGEKKRKGTLGSYYSVKDYHAINPEFGTMEDFKSLVDKIHQMEMYVIIDWVANHTSWDNALITEHPDWFTQDSAGNILAPVPDWTDVADLNYQNRELWDYMIESMAFWLRETDIDGFRCDVAEMVPLEFWQLARKKLELIKPVFMLAEGEKPELHNQAFDASYSWSLFHLMNTIAQNECPATSIDSLLAAEKKLYPPSAMRMRFTSNHDENSWNGTVFERLGDGAKTFAILSATLPGTPLLYSGQEAGMDERLKFFDKHPIKWRVNYFRRFYSRLFNLYKKNAALHNGSMKKINTDKDKFVYAFIREYEKQKVVVVLNLSPDAQQVNLLSSGIVGKYREHFSGRKKELHSTENLSLKPWDYKVWVQEK